MKKGTCLLISLTLIVSMILATGCSSSNEDSNQVANNSSNVDEIFTQGNFASAGRTTFTNAIPSTLGQLSSYQQIGISVSGLGKVTLEPDLAILSLGVDVTAATVKAARSEAATAMTRMIEALRANDVAKKDIQTSFFNISPEYTYEEIYKNDRRYNKQVLTGYSVSNTVTAKIRDLDTVGSTIDEVIENGSDSTRIQSIRFTVEDTSMAQVHARDRAVLDALAKADQFANLTGVTRGSLMFITESSSNTPVSRSFAMMESAPAMADTGTPISAGELQIQVSVQAVFAIADP